MQITVITQISAALGGGGGGFNKYGTTTKRYYYDFKRRPQISTAFLEKTFNELRYISLCTV